MPHPRDAMPAAPGIQGHTRKEHNPLRGCKATPVGNIIHSRLCTTLRQMVSCDQTKQSKGTEHGKWGRASTPQRRITNDDNVNLNGYIIKGKGSKQAINGDSGYLPEDKLREIYEKHYNQILPIMTEKVQKEKLQGVQTHLIYGESSRQNSQTREETQLSELSRERGKPTHRRSSVSTTVFTRLGHRDRNVFKQLRERKKNVYSRLRPEVAPRRKHTNERRSASSSTSTKDPNRRKKDAINLIRSYVTCSSEHQREIEEEWDTADRASRRHPARTEDSYLSKNENDRGGHWKSRPKKRRSNGKDNLSQPWLYEETDPFTARIQYFKVPKKTRMPTNVKIYDGTGDPKDHLKIFQAAAKIEQWAMPTWYHMFNSTLIGSTRVWFDKLPPKSIDNYEVLRKAFLGNFSQQKKYIKDPVEIHHIKQREGESIEAFMERFKVESMHVNREPECMRMYGFMHGITNPDLIKKLNDNIPKSVDEMMSVTTAFLRGEVATANQSRKKVQSMWKHYETSHKLNFDKRLDFKSQHKAGRRQDRFIPLSKTPKEILEIETVKFKAPPLMTRPAKNRNKNKFYEFHEDKGHNTDGCIHLRRKIEEAVKLG
ncbi:reverse transcriptase domain-containing protein [Tanacetum coccineum]